MSIQECALYGELVLYLRDRAAELAASGKDDLEEKRRELDTIIREWFFSPQDGLHGCAPRELIWAEHKGEPNPVRPQHLDKSFRDDCLLCRAELEDAETVLELYADPDWLWYFDDGGYPLIARYDPEGWKECIALGEASFDEWSEDEDVVERVPGFSPGSEYVPRPFGLDRETLEEFLARLRQPWLDPELHRAAQVLQDRIDCPEPSALGVRYRPVRYEEALSLLVGLYEHGVDVESLLAQIEAFPYRSIALDWLSRPTENAALMVEAMEHEIPPEDEAEMARFRNHRDFMFVLSRVIPSGAQLWLQGWLEAVAHGALACAVRDDQQAPGDAF
ncbi:MAG: hypothetical protein PVJ55_06755 [Anaerolineae bacterium]